MGYDTHLVARHVPCVEKEGVRLHATGVDATGPRGALSHARSLLRIVASLRPDVVHLHEPGLIPPGLWLQLWGIPVIYDVHEDYPRQVRIQYQDRPIRARLHGWLRELLDRLAARFFDAFICAAPIIARRFPEQRSSLVMNYPLLELFDAPAADWPEREESARLVYVGWITEARGAREMAEAVRRLPDQLRAVLLLVGEFNSESLRRDLLIVGGERIEWVSAVPHDRVPALLATAHAGLVLLHPTENYRESYPTKLFEYMAAGLPVVASDFPLWRTIVDEAGCGLLVDPRDPDRIAEAIRWLLEHPGEARRMGARGREAVAHRYGWASQLPELRRVYHSLTSMAPT
jgi:glycosyltransferase involved in cell wall biosynthesis